MRPTPWTSPIAGFAGVLGTLVTSTLPVAPSTATMSVKVPPVSMPMRRRPELTAGMLRSSHGDRTLDTPYSQGR